MKAGLLTGSAAAERIVPATGYTAKLTIFTAFVMAFLAVFALALSLAAGRLALRWEAELARTATVRISAPAEQVEAQTVAVLRVLGETPGIASARRFSAAERAALLAPWFGPDLPLDALPLPELVEVIETAEGFDAEGLRLRLAAEAPGALLDDHTRWRRPLVEAAERLRLLGIVSIVLIAAGLAAMVALAAHAALAANRKVIEVLRLIGARDRFIAYAFVLRFARRAFLGALAGALLGMGAVALLPAAQQEGGFLTGLGFRGLNWVLPLVIPPIAALVAFAATWIAAFRVLREMP